MMRRKPHTGRKFALGAVIGGTVGYLAGLLTAPKAGKETREDISKKAADVKSDAEIQLQLTMDDLGEAMQAAKSKSANLNAKARKELDEAVAKAKVAQSKSSEVLKAFRAGEADNPDLNKAVKQAKQAKSNISKYLRS
jgi:gas vesicle protein